MLALPAVFAISAIGANQAARLMTSKSFVRWLAQSTKVRPNGWGAHVGRLAGVAASSPDLDVQQALMDYMTALDQGKASNNGN